jgi:hypothetical protein
MRCHHDSDDGEGSGSDAEAQAILAGVEVLPLGKQAAPVAAPVAVAGPAVPAVIRPAVPAATTTATGPPGTVAGRPVAPASQVASAAFPVVASAIGRSCAACELAGGSRAR